MTLTLRAFSPSDPPRIDARPDFAADHRLAGEPLFGPVRPVGLCWTMCDGDEKWSRPLACGGLEPLGHGRFSGWLYAADLTPRGWVMIARAFANMIEVAQARRVEINVRVPTDATDWPSVLGACAFAEHLGLSREGVMKGWGPDGSDFYLYAGVF